MKISSFGDGVQLTRDLVDEFFSMESLTDVEAEVRGIIEFEYSGDDFSLERRTAL